MWLMKQLFLKQYFAILTDNSFVVICGAHDRREYLQNWK